MYLNVICDNIIAKILTYIQAWITSTILFYEKIKKCKATVYLKSLLQTEIVINISKNLHTTLSKSIQCIQC